MPFRTLLKQTSFSSSSVGGFLALCLSAASAWGGEVPGIESFELGIPDYFEAARPGSLSLGPWHSLHGTNSLRWDWKKGEALTIRQGIGDPSRVGGFLNRAAFAVSVFMEAPVDGALRFDFRAGDSVTGSFRFPLQFKGWRQARIFYDTFPEGRPTAEVDNIRVEAPAGVPLGTTFFDLVRYNTLVYYSASIDPEALARRRRPGPEENVFPLPASVTADERSALEGLTGRLAGAGGRGFPDNRAAALFQQVEALGIVRDEHGIRGPGLVRSSFYFASPGEFGGKDVKAWPDEQGPEGIEANLPGPEPVVRLADALASAWRSSAEAEQRRRLQEDFHLLAEHLLDQGLSVSVESVIRMRAAPELAELLDAHLERLLFTLGAESFFVPEGRPVMANMDFYASSGPYRLRNMMDLCLAQADEVEQVRWLNAWKAMFERSLLQADAPFKPDGSAYHHRGHYPSYAQNAFGRLPLLLAELRGTPWFPSAEALAVVRRALLAQRFYHNLCDKPVALAGRSPFAGGIYDGLLPGFGDQAFALMARLGTPDGRLDVDPELAAAYLRLAPAGRDAESFRALGIAPEPEPEGTYVMPYAALLCHRREGWLASVKAQSRYVWGSERQARRNAYGLFLGLGSLEILAGGAPVSAAASGRSGRGWDWRRFEGVTAPLLPLPELDQGWSFVSGTIRSPESFAGGLSHQGRQGLFGMVLNLPVHSSRHVLRGRKSWFFVDDLVVCLGSDLAYGDARHPLQTTLCQKALSTNAAGAFPPTPLDGGQFAAFPEDRALDPGRAHWFLDVQDTGYYLPAGQTAALARRRQTSRDVGDAHDTEGDFMTAWIDHGAAASDAAYEYALQVRSSADAMARLAAAVPYQVLQRDADAHIVRFAPSGRWGCVLFAAGAVAPHRDGPDELRIEAVDRPCLVLLEPETDGCLDLTVADPDLNLVDGVSAERALRISLRGRWSLREAHGTLCAWPCPEGDASVRVLSDAGGRTVIEVHCRHGASYGLRLVRAP